MKSRFSTIDIVAILAELQKYVGMRLNRVYDIDSKTYLFKLNRQEEKVTLLIESGIRIHTTEFEWPKNPAPSGFSMKLRKHLKNKRLEKLVQLGIDRVIDMQFGSDDAAYHVILELYDKGNIALTDYTYMILNILRPRTIGSEDVKLMVREKYPVENARQGTTTINREEIYTALNASKPFSSLKKTLMPCLPFGPAVLDHVLSQSKFPRNCSIGKQFSISSDINHLFLCLEEAEKFMTEASSGQCKGYIIQKVENDAVGNRVVANVEFHPFLYAQHKSSDYAEYPSFDKAVDNFFSSLEGQKIDLKALQKEKEAMKKLENVRKDHEQRLQQLQKGQEEDVKKAQMIEMNLDFVDRAILIMRGTIAGQFSWDDIHEMVRDAKRNGDPVANAIVKLKLEINHITLMLNDPYADDYSDDDDNNNSENSKSSMAVDIDLGLSAYANARKYYDQKRHFAKKEQKTIESSEKAYKSAERKTKLALKEVAVIMSVTKARKTFWFEKFLWFISSENYLVIAGRDIQQNELIVKRYMKPGDVYVHADIHGASSVIIKNFQGGDIPPKTLNEAGTMAICYSTAWDAKIVTSAWWVYHHQVSKTAPSGEYLTAGSFMIRGKKNYLPPSHLILGFGFLFKLDEDSLGRHSGERNLSDDIQTDNASLEAQDEVNDLMSDDDGTSTENNEEQHLEDIDENQDGESTCSSDKHSSSNNSNVEFPDTEIKFDMLKIEPSKDEENVLEDVLETTMIVQVPRKVKKATKTKKNILQEEEEKERIQEISKKEKQQGALKRGQKGKLKKIKEKYKDQDEEERELRMKILASAGERKEDKKKKKNKDAKITYNKPNNKQKTVHFAKVSEEGTCVSDMKTEAEEKIDVPATNTSDDVSAPVVQEHNASDDEIEDADHDTHTSEDLKILCSLTGMPTSEDTLIFALPVCAPYMAMQNYKYKVKVTPGGGRRGKASKTALQLFLHDKSGTSREKDLLRSVKDQDISRNFPGKVKISAPNLKKAK